MKLYKRISLLLSMGIMGIGLITFSFVPFEKSSIDPAVPVQNENPTPTPVVIATATPTPSPTPVPTPTPEPNLLTKVTSGEIYDLIVAYLNAKLTCDASAFTDLVTDTNFIDEAELMHRTEMILSYNDIVCYLKRGIGAIDYIVYYTYTMDIATIDTKAVSIEQMYITTDDTGNYRIFLGYLDKETKDALLALDEDEDVVSLVSSTYDKMTEEIESDEDLLAFWMRLYEGAEEEESESDSEEYESESGSEEVG